MSAAVTGHEREFVIYVILQFNNGKKYIYLNIIRIVLVIIQMNFYSL